MWSERLVISGGGGGWSREQVRERDEQANVRGEGEIEELLSTCLVTGSPSLSTAVAAPALIWSIFCVCCHYYCRTSSSANISANYNNLTVQVYFRSDNYIFVGSLDLIISGGASWWWYINADYRSQQFENSRQWLHLLITVSIAQLFWCYHWLSMHSTLTFMCRFINSDLKTRISAIR